jgi:hypothetical protein
MGLGIADCQLPIADCRLPGANCHLLKSAIGNWKLAIFKVFGEPHE